MTPKQLQDNFWELFHSKTPIKYNTGEYLILGYVEGVVKLLELNRDFDDTDIIEFVELDEILKDMEEKQIEEEKTLSTF